MNADTEDLFATHIGLEDEDARFSWERNYPGDQGHSQMQEPAAAEHVTLRGGAPTGGRADSNSARAAAQADRQAGGVKAEGGPPALAASGDAASAPAGPTANGAAADVAGASDTDTDDEETVAQRKLQQQQAAAAEEAARAAAAQPKPVAAPAPKKRPPGKSRPSGGITLKLLMEEGILKAGEQVLTVEYKGQTTKGTLCEDGRIRCTINGQDQTFESPSAFSIYLKRLINPSRKADDGWKTVKYEGKFLEHFKLELARRRFPVGKPAEAGTAAAGGEHASFGQPPAKKQRIEGSGSQQMEGRADGHATQNGHGGDTQIQRPRRQIKRPAWMNVRHEDDHQMMPCHQYSEAAPGSQAEGAQPFRVEASPTALLVMDYHAHLNMNEIIGFLGGSYDEERRVLRVLKAYPGIELQTEDDRINVEMDPEDDFRVRQLMQQENMRCVGWYHSHPHFETLPSLVDIGNQVAQQHAHRCDSGQEPYIGAIVGPYGVSDPQSSPDISTIDWFHVDHPSGRVPSNDEDPLQAGCRPMQLQVAEMASLADGMTLVQLPQGELQQLALRYAPLPTRADLRGSWREGRSRLQKLKESIAARLPAGWQVTLRKQFLQAVEVWTKSAFSKFPQDKSLHQPTYNAGGASSRPSQPAPAAEDDPEISDVSDEEPEGSGSSALQPAAPQEEEPFDPRSFYDDSPRAQDQDMDRGGASVYGVQAGAAGRDEEDEEDEELSDPGSAATQENETALPAPAHAFQQQLDQAHHGQGSGGIGQSISEDEPEAEDEASDDSEATS
ncbi:hypothetical protein WJX84_011457 [Apatococcus fuscideae]|uniref:MPN domain-containing protein n=1 Tax=Apatococcus fuscideae TaxID=2026836 RepID=A0AAW1TB88_9CHLO